MNKSPGILWKCTFWCHVWGLGLGIFNKLAVSAPRIKTPLNCQVPWRSLRFDAGSKKRGLILKFKDKALSSQAQCGPKLWSPHVDGKPWESSIPQKRLQLIPTPIYQFPLSFLAHTFPQFQAPPCPKPSLLCVSDHPSQNPGRHVEAFFFFPLCSSSSEESQQHF